MNDRLDKKGDGPRVPVRRNGVATRARIVDAAIALMAQDGETLAMRSLARQAGCSPAAIYQFFADLDDVGAAVIETVSADALAELGPRLSAPGAARDAVAFFAAVIDGVVALQASRPATLCLARPQPGGPRAALALALRALIRGLVAEAFVESRPGIDRARLGEVLDLAQHAMIGALAGLPPRGAPGREAYLADVAQLVGGYVDQALAGPCARAATGPPAITV